MRTSFTLAQLADPAISRANDILRNCVHCGFCTATCPTYVLLGDERDSPRGRIYLIKAMFEEGRVTEETVSHVDRCLSCLSCMTTCPSGVDYMHLVDLAREHIETRHRRPLAERTLRSLLALVLPRPALFRLALRAAVLARPLKRLMPRRLAAMLDLAPSRLPASSDADSPGVKKAVAPRRLRVAMLTGCAQRVLDAEINEATIRLLTRLGCEIEIAPGSGCCGALTHHMGKSEAAKRDARRNTEAWMALHRREPLDAILINASGCGTTVKDYATLLADDAGMAADAATVAGLAMDVSEVLAGLDPASWPFMPDRVSGMKVAYHAACSLQHGQKIRSVPKDLLRAAGFDVAEPAEAHLCCGSAGTYNIMQPELAGRLKERKLGNLRRTGADVIVAGNIGCITQIAAGGEMRVLHLVQLLDWATGGPIPAALRKGRADRG